MAKRGRKPSTPVQPSGEIHYAEARAAGIGKLQGDARQGHMVWLGDPPPPPARDWLKEAAARLAAATDSPERVTDAAHLLEEEMYEAFLRRRVDERWGWGSIKNFLINENFWPRTRRPRA